MNIHRRTLLAGLGATALTSQFAYAAKVKDATGREIQTPDKVTRVFPAGPPAAIMLYTLAPDLMLGWTRTPSPAEKEFLTARRRNGSGAGKCKEQKPHWGVLRPPFSSIS